MTESAYGEVCTDFEAELKQFNDEQDHEHLLAHYPPKAQLSKLVNSVSSRRLRTGVRRTHPPLPVGRPLLVRSYIAGSCDGR
ncbi:transposase [Streptomyces sp. NPDC056002]|uniref:transposase n=1 Tax=Streptomyces sp. NPDC056002 TaxID=3345675 RepID=UPI0035D59AF1